MFCSTTSSDEMAPTFGRRINPTMFFLRYAPASERNEGPHDAQPKTLKRKAADEEKEQKCPMCHEKYDLMDHNPLSSPCGHFLCAACNDWSRTTTCYQCDPPADHEFKLAMDLIVALIEKEPIPVKKRKLHYVEKEFAPEEEVPVILQPNNISFLTHIINQLDPSSFVKLARTCKTMHNVCFNSKGIKIVHDRLNLNGFGDNRLIFDLSDDLLPNDREHVSAFWKTLGFGRYPFVYKLKELVFPETLHDNWLRIIRSYISRFPGFSIKKILFGTIEDWNGFFQFLQDFQPELVCLGDEYGEASQIPEEMAIRLLSGVVKKLHCNCVIPDQLILDSSLAGLNISGPAISRETLKALLKKCSRSIDDLEWTFKINSADFGHHDLFKTLPFDFEGPVCEDRPLIFIKEGKPNIFWLLREDGKVVFCCNHTCENSVCFIMADVMAHAWIYPPCLISAPVISSLLQ